MKKFILTKELGRLARWLRILGFDTEYFKSDNHSTLIIQALREDRTVLTRNSHLGQHRGMKLLVLKSDSLKDQIRELMQYLNLEIDKKAVFSRCIICNQQLQPAAKEEVRTKIPTYVFETQKDFVFCPVCQRIYWQGTHWGNVQEILETIS